MHFLIFDKFLISEHDYCYMRCEEKRWKIYTFVIFGKWRRELEAPRVDRARFGDDVRFAWKPWYSVYLLPFCCLMMHAESLFIFFFCLFASLCCLGDDDELNHFDIFFSSSLFAALSCLDVLVGMFEYLFDAVRFGSLAQ